MWNRTTPKTTAPRRSSPGIQAPESRHLGTDAMTAGESSDCGKPISISNRYCVASHNAYYAREINMLAGFSIFSNSDLPRAANDEMQSLSTELTQELTVAYQAIENYWKSGKY